jgi:tetratricopeptide (TPR) repeat protein
MDEKDEKEQILKAQNPYQILLLSTTATPEEAKYQYFKLVKKYSPEREESAFRKIRRAYEEIKDPVKKATADVMLFTAPAGRVRFSGITTSTASQIKLNREIADLETQPADAADQNRQILELLKQRGVLWAKNSRWGEALKDLDKIAEVGGDTAELTENRIFVLSRMALKLAEGGHYAEACHRWRRALKLDPNRSTVLHNLAVCATLMLNRQDEDKYWVDTLRAWHKELSTRGDDVYLKNLIVETHKRFGGKYLNQTGDENLREQVRQVQAAASVGVPHAVGGVGMGPQQTPRTGPPRSVSARPGPYRSVSARTGPPLTVGPPAPLAGDPDVQAGLDAFGRQSWLEAVRHFENHLKGNPDDGSVMDKMGWALLHAGQGNKAFGLWAKMLSSGPDKETGRESFIRAKLETARNLRKRMMHNPALVQLKDVLKQIPDSKEVLVELAEIYRDREDWVNSSYYYEKALEVDQNDKEIRHILRKIRTKARSVRAIM